jgi:hypothetical protein
MTPETMVAGVPETGFKQPCLVIDSGLVDVSNLAGGVAIAGLGLDLDLALVTITDRSVWLVWLGSPQIACLQKLAPPRLKGWEAVIPLLPQRFRLRHLADVEIPEINLVEQVVEQRLISTIVEFCLQTSEVFVILFSRGRYGWDKEASRRITNWQEVIGITGDRQV